MTPKELLQKTSREKQDELNSTYEKLNVKIKAMQDEQKAIKAELAEWDKAVTKIQEMHEDGADE
jgi:chaperonin cofactor prefoldin